MDIRQEREGWVDSAYQDFKQTFDKLSVWRFLLKLSYWRGAWGTTEIDGQLSDGSYEWQSWVYPKFWSLLMMTIRKLLLENNFFIEELPLMYKDFFHVSSIRVHWLWKKKKGRCAILSSHICLSQFPYIDLWSNPYLATIRKSGKSIKKVKFIDTFQWGFDRKKHISYMCNSGFWLFGMNLPYIMV